MSNKSSTDTARLYVSREVNDRLDRAHLRVQSRCGVKIPKAEFLSHALAIGLDNEDVIYEHYKRRQPIAS
jgi:hypothetical protein